MEDLLKEQMARYQWERKKHKPPTVIIRPLVKERVFFVLALRNSLLPVEIINVILTYLVSHNYKCSKCGVIDDTSKFSLLECFACRRQKRQDDDDLMVSVAAFVYAKKYGVNL